MRGDKYPRRVAEALKKRSINTARAVTLTLALTAAAVVIFLYQFDIMGRFELMTLDARFSASHLKPKPSNIILIDISDDSIRAVGRWPWPRKWLAALIRILTEYKASAVVVDILFSEPQDPADDAILEQAIKESGAVYLPVSYDFSTRDMENSFKGRGIVTVNQPINGLRAAAKGVGHITAINDSDGVLRRVPAIMRYKDLATYHLGFKAGVDLLGVKDSDISFLPSKHYLKYITGAKSAKIPLDDDNEIVINWRGRWQDAFKHYSYIDVVSSYAMMKEGRKPLIDLNELRGKICIVGLTAAGLTDIKPNPVQIAYPAPGIDAVILYSVLNNDFLASVTGSINISLIIILSIAMSFYFSRLKFFGGLLSMVSAMIVYAIISGLAFSLFNLVVLTFYPMLAIFLSYSFTSLYKQAALSLERISLLRQATTDGLTALYNIRHFNLLFEAEFRNVSMYKFRRLAIVMADVDDFKRLNDTYGHQAGDVVLKKIGAAIMDRCRKIDVVGRFGGDEFIVMLIGAGEKEAVIVGEKIRAAVESKRFKLADVNLNVTVSIGVAEYSGEKKPSELVEKADRAMYKSKEGGKNRVTAFSSIAKS